MGAGGVRLRPDSASATISVPEIAIQPKHLASALSIALTVATPIFAQEPLAPIGLPVMTRDAEGHATVRAVRLSQPLRIDGRLDDEIYQTVSADHRLHPDAAEATTASRPSAPKRG